MPELRVRVPISSSRVLVPSLNSMSLVVPTVVGLHAISPTGAPSRCKMAANSPSGAR